MGEGVAVILGIVVAVAVDIAVGIGLASIEHPTKMMVISTRVEKILSRTGLGYRKSTSNACKDKYFITMRTANPEYESHPESVEGC